MQEQDQPAGDAPERDDAADWQEAMRLASGDQAADEAAPAEAADPEKTEAADEAAEGADEADPWAEAPETLRKEYEDAKAAAELARQQRDSDRGRLLAYERELEALRKRTTEPPKPAAEDAPKSADLAKLREEYPEIAEPLIASLAERDRSLAEMRQALDAITTERQAQQAAQLDMQARQLEERHPDYGRFLAERRDAFAAWLDDQPRAVREAAAVNAQDIVDADLAARVLDAFKQHIGQSADGAKTPDPIADKRQRQMRAATGVRTTSRPAATGIPREGDPDAMWKAISAEVEREMQQR